MESEPIAGSFAALQIFGRCTSVYQMLVPHLKGQCREMDIFLKVGLNILCSAFCVCADGFQGLSKAFSYNFFYSLKLLTNFENAY